LDNSVLKSRPFISSLSKGIASRLYLFLGEEESEKERAVNELRAIYFGRDEGEFRIFHADSGELMDAASFLLSSSMFSKKKMALIKGLGSASKNAENAEESTSGTSKKKGEAQLIGEIVNSDGFIAIFSTSAKICPPLIKKNISSFTQVIFYPPFENDVIAYISGELKKKGKILTSDSARFVASLVGRSYEKADDAIEKITYGSKGPSPDTGELRLLLCETRETSVFEYIDALFSGNKNSFALLKHVLDGGSHELQVLALVNRKLREIERSLPDEDADYFSRVAYQTERALKSYKPQSFLSNPLVAMTAAFLRMPSEF